MYLPLTVLSRPLPLAIVPSAGGRPWTEQVTGRRSERIAQSQQAFAASSAPFWAVTCVKLAKSYVASTAEYASHEHRRTRRKGERKARMKQTMV